MNSTSIQIVELLIQQDSMIAELHLATAEELRGVRAQITALAADVDNRVLTSTTRAENAAASRDYLSKILAQLKATP